MWQECLRVLCKTRLTRFCYLIGRFCSGIFLLIFRISFVSYNFSQESFYELRKEISDYRPSPQKYYGVQWMLLNVRGNDWFEERNEMDLPFNPCAWNTVALNSKTNVYKCFETMYVPSMKSHRSSIEISYTRKSEIPRKLESFEIFCLATIKTGWEIGRAAMNISVNWIIIRRKFTPVWWNRAALINTLVPR